MLLLSSGIFLAKKANFWPKNPVRMCKLGFRIDPSSCILTLFDGRFMTDFFGGQISKEISIGDFVLFQKT